MKVRTRRRRLPAIAATARRARRSAGARRRAAAARADAATPPDIAITLPPSPSADFTLGTFTHVNQPITGETIAGIQLVVTADIAVDAGPAQSLSFIFDFMHDETPNDVSLGEDCPYGGADHQRVNINGCADHVQVGYNTLSKSFNVGGDLCTR